MEEAMVDSSILLTIFELEDTAPLTKEDPNFKEWSDKLLDLYKKYNEYVGRTVFNTSKINFVGDDSYQKDGKDEDWREPYVFARE